MKSLEFVYVSTIIEEKSFSKAAKKLGVSQPALSAYVNKIEKRIGSQLFDRSTSPIQLTEVGEHYLEYAKTVLDAKDRFSDIVSDLSDLKTGKMVIGSTSCFSACYLPSVLSKFLEKYPGIHINLVEGRIPDIQQQCLEGKVDLFLSDANLNTELFACEPLFDECILVMVPPQNPINERLKDYSIPLEAIMNEDTCSDSFRDIDVKLLKDERFVLLNEDQHIRKISEEVCKKAGFKPKEIMQVPQMMTSFSLTNAGVGVSFITESAVRYNNIHNHPIYYRISKDLCSRSISIAYKKNKYLLKACKLLIQQLKSDFGS